MKSQEIAEINRKAWNKILQSGKNIHPYMGVKQTQWLEYFIKQLPINAKVLDLGCGTGLPIGKELAKSGKKIVGLDVSDEMVKQYNSNVPNAETYRMPMTEMSWIDEFDGMVSSFSMLSLPPDDFKNVAEKIKLALKKNGWFLLILNEGDSRYGYVQEVQGERMYSTGVSEQEVRDSFEPELKLLNLDSETVTTKEYGTENTIMFLFQKSN